MNRRPVQRLLALLATLAVNAPVWAGVTAGAAAIGIAASAALAQQAPGAGEGAQGGQNRGRLGKVLVTLGLSDAQKTRIREIMKDARAKNQGVTDPQIRRTNMRAAFAQVEAVLTPSQRDDLHKKMQAMRAQTQPQPQQQ
ncbi:MAG TPA: hypothetical protein VE591_08910 [Candidatus Acidoferrum sp.]|nr:hypothetical protein [Candidatus Acidoferrum sp.]